MLRFLGLITPWSNRSPSSHGPNNVQHITDSLESFGFNSDHQTASPTYPSGSVGSRGPTLKWLQKVSVYDDHKVCMEAFDYVARMPSKKLREALIAGLQEWYQVPQDSLAIISNVIGMLHTSSLILDDIEDGSTSRRGLPAAHVKFGIAKAINSANYVFAVANLEIMRLKNSAQCMQIYSEELALLHHGQGLDIHYRDSLQCPTEEEYAHVVRQKTGGLFRMLVRLMAAESPSHHDLDLTRLATLLGELFQIRDDYKNLTCAEYTAQKGFCEDLDEGKFSLMMIHGINSSPQDRFLINVLRMAKDGESELSYDVKKEAVHKLDALGSFEYARAKMQALQKELKREYLLVEKVAGKRNEVVEDMIRKLGGV